MYPHSLVSIPTGVPVVLLSQNQSGSHRCPVALTLFFLSVSVLGVYKHHETIN